MDDDNLPSAWQMMQDPADSPGNGRRLQLYSGFHGSGVASDSAEEYMEDLARDGFRGAVSDAWIDNLYFTSIQYTGVAGDHELCPVAYSIGAGAASCEDRLLSTGYGSVGSDPATTNWYCYTYVAGCDSHDETSFVPQ
jgi:hypothetical protein